MFPSLAYASPADTILSTIQLYNDYHSENYLERIVVRLDKDFYLSGEYLRFSIYCLDARSRHFSPLSKVAYIELLESGPTSVLQAKILLEDGKGYGEIFLPANMSSGNYLLRGYTNWMKNYRADLYFHVPVHIINPFVKPTLEPLSEADPAGIQFFPEGGSLVYGMPSKVAFTAVDTYGNRIEFSGKITDDMGNDVLRFSPGRAGVGSFDFKPEAPRTYRASILFHDSTLLPVSLPEIREEGVILKINNLEEEKIIVKVISNRSTPTSPLYLIGQSSGEIHFKEPIHLNDGMAQITLNKRAIDPGVLQFTLFTSNAEVLSERAIFIHPEAAREVHIITNREKYGNREKVILEIATNDEKNQPISVDMSISVSLYNDHFDRYDDHIQTAMFLNSGSLDFIQDPDLYLYGRSETARQAMDDLMLILDNRAFRWEDMTEMSHKKPFLPELRNHIITGSLMDWRTRSGIDGIPVYLSVVSKNSNFFTTRSQDDGKLYVEMSDFFGHHEIIAQTNNTVDSTYQIRIDNPFSDEYAYFKVPSFDIDRELQHFIEVASRNMQVQNAYLKYRPPSYIVSSTDTSTFYEPDATYYLDDYTRFPVMEEVFREYITGVYVRRNADKYHLRILDFSRTETFKENPLILLDGLPVFDATDIINLNPLNIKKIETVRRRFLNGVNLFNGIVSLFSYEGNLGGYTPDAKALRMNYEGLQPHRDYSGPSYDTILADEERIPDYRNVLYWNPQARTDENGILILEFYTSDNDGLYKIEVEGISLDGLPVSGKAYIEVGNNPEK